MYVQKYLRTFLYLTEILYNMALQQIISEYIYLVNCEQEDISIIHRFY